MQTSMSPMSMAHKVDLLNETAKSEAYIVPPERQREEIGSDYYRGGMVVGRAGHLHPALLFKGLLDLCQQRNIPIATKTPATKLTQTGSGWRVDTPRGAIAAGDVIIASIFENLWQLFEELIDLVVK